MATGNNFYDITKVIKDGLLNGPFTNTVTYGNITEVDLNKTTIFPLAHMNIVNADFNENTWTYDFDILVMDIVDWSNEDEVNNLVGNDNTFDILNTQQAVCGRLLGELKRGNIAINGYELEDGATCEPFQERFENHLAGWNLQFSVTVANSIPIC
tara:strand:- start:31850 stop:32314 length:465 start_codon:yes stop_codon:yes gene_type:complete